MQIVDKRDAATLVPIITAHVAPSTIVHSDGWTSYSQVPNVTSHGTVNHSVCFVDPTSGVHTQHIEPYWGRAKLKLKRMKGCHAHQLPSYLDEFMWRERHGKTSKDALDNILPFNIQCNSYVFSTYYLPCLTFASNA